MDIKIIKDEADHLLLDTRVKASNIEINEFLNNPITKALLKLYRAFSKKTESMDYAFVVPISFGVNNSETTIGMSLCRNGIKQNYYEEGAIRYVISCLLCHVYSLDRTKIFESTKAIDIAEVLNDEILHDKKVNEDCEILYDFLYNRKDGNQVNAIRQEYCNELKKYKKSKLAEAWRNYARDSRKHYEIPKFLCEAITNLNYDCIDNVDIDESKLPEGMTKEMAIDCLKKAANPKKEDNK